MRRLFTNLPKLADFLRTYGPAAVRTAAGSIASGRRSYRKELWIHIGAHKTATTFLQGQLYRERFGLMAQSVWFDQESIEFGESVCYSSPLSPSDLMLKKEMLERKILKRPERVVIWSSEFFIGDPEKGYRNAEAVSADLRRLTSSFDVKLVVCVRRQDQFIQSWYHQHLKRGGCDSFDCFLERVGDRSFCWYRILRHFESDFGRENLRVLTYESLRHRSRPIIEVFFGSHSHVLKMRADLPTRSNPSLSEKGLRLALLCFPDLTIEERKQLRNFLLKAFPRSPNEQFSLFDPVRRKELLDHYRESNEALFERYLGGAANIREWE